MSGSMQNVSVFVYLVVCFEILSINSISKLGGNMSINTVATSVKKGIVSYGESFLSNIRSYNFKYNEASSRISMSL